MNRILSLQFYFVSSSSAAPWPSAAPWALPLQQRDLNYGNGDTNTFSKRMFEQFTQYLTGWQICQLPLSSEGSKLFSFKGPPWPPDQGLCPWTPLGALPPDPRYNPHSKPPGLATGFQLCGLVSDVVSDLIGSLQCGLINVNAELCVFRYTVMHALN